MTVESNPASLADEAALAYEYDGEGLRNTLVTDVLDARGLAGRRRDVATWHGTAFMLEAVLLLVFVAFSLTTVANLFSGAHRVGREANELSAALTLASTASRNGAETFAANPTEDVPEVMYYRLEGSAFVEVPAYDGEAYVVRRVVQEQQLEGGVLYKASINVEKDRRTVYNLPTAKYVSSGRLDDRVDSAEQVDLAGEMASLELTPVVVYPDLVAPEGTLMVIPSVGQAELHPVALGAGKADSPNVAAHAPAELPESEGLLAARHGEGR